MAAAELKLQVGLDLAFFRQQLALLGTTAAGYSLPINIDRLAIQREITKLGKNISSRKYTLKITSDLRGINADIIKLQKALESAGKESVNIQVTGTGSLNAKEASKIRTELRSSILANGGKIKVPATIKAAITQDDIRDFKNAVKSKLTGLSVDVKANVQGKGFAGTEQGYEGLMGYMQKQGLIGKTASGMTGQMGKNGDNIKQQLGDAVKSAEKIKSIFDGVAQSIATTGKSTANVQGKRLSLGNVPLMAGGVERRIEQSSAAIGATLSADALKALYPEVSKTIASFVALKGQIQQNTSKLSGFSLIIGLAAFAGVPLAKSVVKLTGSADSFAKLLDQLGLKLDAAFTKAAFNILSATSGRMLSGGSVAGLLPAAYRGIGGSAGPAGLLPPAYRGIGSSRNAGALPPAYRGIGSSTGPAGLLPSAYRGIRPSAGSIGFLPPAYRGIGPSAGPAGLLPRTTRAGAMGDTMRMLSQGASEESPGVLAKTTKARIDEIISKYLRMVEVQVNQAFGAPFELKKQLNKFSYLVQALRDAEARTGQMQMPFSRAIGGTGFGGQRLLPGSNIAGYLPPIASFSAGRDPNPYSTGRLGREGETQAELFARREREARVKSAFREMALSTHFTQPQRLPGTTFAGDQFTAGGGRDSVRGTGQPPQRGGALAFRQTPLTSDYYKNAFRYSEALKVADASMRNFSASQIPFIGGLRGVAGELGQATKQVLLYGTAYRALAAITAIPGQILNAAKSQQQYTNGLKVATQETGTFAKELLFVDNVQRAFGLNLETTRTGFTRLYASMAPTGFDSGSIEKLFTGISAATAALQLTPDKAERVIYAFGQMASKGQIMSEELKGQLGDVLPGALAIFAKSAGMSVKEFSKAMEDGVFTGDKFREVFAKVSDELMTRFGTGAQAAGKSLQGLLSTVGGDVQRTLESFAPLANAAAQATLLPLAGMLRDVSMAAQIAMGEQDRVKKQLEDSQKDVSDLKAGGASAKEIKAAEQNVAALAAKYEVLNEAAKDPAIAQQVKNIEAFVTEVQKAATFTMNLAGVIGNVLSPFITVLGGNLTSVIGNLALLVLGFNAARLAVFLYMGAMSATAAVAGITRGGAVGATLLAGAFRLLGAQATAANVATGAFGLTVKGLLISTGVGALVVLIGSVAAAFLSVGDKAKQAADRAKQSIDSMTDAARTGNVSLIEMNLSVNKADQKDLDNLIAKVEKLQANAAGRGGGSVALTPELQREAKRLGAEVASATNKDALLTSLKELREPLKKEAASGAQDLIAAQKRAKLLGLNKPTPDPATGADDVDPAAAAKAKALYENQKAYADKLSAAQTEADIKRQTTRFDNEKSMINMAYDLREARANSFEKETIRFQKELFNIEMTRQKAVMDANNEITKAQGKVAGGTGGIGGMNEGAAGLTSYITGDPSQKGKGYQPDHGTVEQYHDHLAFATRELAIQAYNKLTAADIKVTEIKGYGKGVTGPHSGAGSLHHQGLAMDVPGIQWGGTGAIGAKDYAGSARVRQVMGIGDQSNTGGRISASQSRAGLAAQAERNALQNKTTKLTLAEVEAVKQAEIATANYVASIMPAAEQELQNKLLQRRTELMRTGITPGQIDTEMRIYEAQAKQSEGLKAFSAKVETLNKLKEKNGTLSKEDQDNLNLYNAIIKELTKNMSPFTKSVRDGATATRDLAYEAAKINLGDRLKMAQAFTPEAEMRVRIKQQNPEATESQLGDLFKTEQTATKAEELKTQMQGVASTIGDAFSTAFQGIINGSMSAQEALGNMFKSIGESFVKMAMDMIAKQLVMITLGFIMKALGLAGAAAGAGSTPLPGSAPQMTPNAIVTPTGFQGMIPSNFAAKGASFSNGIAKFATGGIVNGPTLFPFADGGAMQMGLMGEAGPEAIMPLQRGADGSLGVRAAMGGNGMGGSSSSVLNMSFETSTINGVEYVSRDQLELAMAQTRRQASRDGANKGMAMTLDKIQQSPQTRRRIGM